MFKKTITYEDYNGVKRTEDFHFHFSKAEIIEMQLSTAGGLDATIKRIVAANNEPEIIRYFKDLVLKAYGEKSADGRMKSPEISRAFAETEAYSVLFMELATDAKAAAEFVNGLLPADVREQAKVEADKIVAGQFPEA